MRHLLTAGTLALALTVTGPARAQTFDTTGVTEALIAAVAAYLIGDLIGDRREERAQEAQLAVPADPPVVGRPTTPDGILLPPRELGGLGTGATQPVTQAPPRGILPPASEVVSVSPACRIARGAYDARCVIETLPVWSTLPAECRNRRLVDGVVRDVFAADCLRAAGYRTPR